MRAVRKTYEEGYHEGFLAGLESNREVIAKLATLQPAPPIVVCDDCPRAEELARLLAGGGS